MSWLIKCGEAVCGKNTWVADVVDLISSHRDAEGWFVCGECGARGYIEKSFAMQEGGDRWEPYLRGVVPLGTSGDVYQPFVFLVSYEPDGPASDLWFSYYKDLRESGGRLKLGYGPGSPPVLGKREVVGLLRQLKRIGYLTLTEIDN